MLTDGDLSGVDLRGAVFLGANLERCKFRTTNLVGATFEGARVADADFSGATLVLAEVGDAVGIERARCDAHTTLPLGWKCTGGLFSR